MRLCALLITAAVTCCALPAAAKEMTVALQGSPAVQNVLRRALVQPFTASAGIPINSVDWNGGIDALHGAGAAGPPWDIVQIGAADLRQACDQGLLEKLDWAAIGGRDHYLSIAASDCGVGAFLHSLILAWSPEKFPGTPTWGDFWDVAKIPGKRGLQRRAQDDLEIALLADGVAPGDIYASLRTTDGVDRAFRKLDQLKPYIVWWGDDISPTHLLSSGEVLMSSAPNDLVAASGRAVTHPLEIQWSGSLYTVSSWAILKDSPHLADANRFLTFAGDPARQPDLLPFGSFAKGASDKLPPDQAAASPSAPANLANALRVEASFWLENGPKLEARFQEWLRAH